MAPPTTPPCTRMLPPSPETLLKGAAAFGAAGWAIENVYAGPRYSWLLGGKEGGIPWLPVYATGGAAVLLAAPHLQKMPLLARFILYTTGLAGLEYLACKTERAIGKASWDYEGYCVDVPHSVAWGALAMVAERVAKGLQEQARCNPSKTAPARRTPRRR